MLLRLSLLVLNTGWKVFHNLGEAGYDILMLNSETDERIRIEVKTRQKLYTVGKHKNVARFSLPDGEYKACDFLIAYDLGKNLFFIVPKADLISTTSNGEKGWRLVVSYNYQGECNPGNKKYLDAWHTLHPDFAGKKLI